jgi:hypothetical protein
VFAPPLPLADMALGNRQQVMAPALGTERYPVFMKRAGFVPGDALLDAILDEQPYPVRAMIFGGGNPALTWPNSRRVAAALEALDYRVLSLKPIQKGSTMGRLPRPVVIRAGLLRRHRARSSWPRVF